MKNISLTEKQFETLIQTVRKSNRRLANNIESREKALPYLKHNGIVTNDDVVYEKASEQLEERKQRFADQQDLLKALEEA